MTNKPENKVKLYAALNYAENCGWLVFPLHNATGVNECSCGDPKCGNKAGKHPRTTDGFHSATTDLDTITKWWTDYPDANIGVRTGPESGIFVLDVDKKSNGHHSLEAFTDKYGDLTTLKSNTGGGGKHYIFKYPIDKVIACSAGRVAEGLDIRGLGGYIVAAPGSHWSGGEYFWDELEGPDDVAIETAPLWLSYEIGQVAERSPSAPGSRFEIPESIPEGTRHDVLHKLGSSLRAQGFDYHEILAALKISRDSRATSSSTVMEDSEVEALAADICNRYERGNASEKAPAAPQSTTGLLERVWTEFSVDDLTDPPPPRRWLIKHPHEDEGVLPLNCAGIIGAEGGAGKTAALISLAISVATGRMWFDYFVVSKDAIYGRSLLLLGEETKEECQRRLWQVADALALTDEEKELVAKKVVCLPLAGYPAPLVKVEGEALIETEFLGDIKKKLKSGGPWSLVVVDPLSRFAGGAESVNELATMFFQVVESVCRSEGTPTVLVSAHSSKLARRTSSADVRGVTGLTDAARWVSTLTKKADGVVEFEQIKSNYSMPFGPIRLRWHERVLFAESDADKAIFLESEEAKKESQLESDIKRIESALKKEGEIGARDSVVRAAGLNLTRGRAALDLSISRGLVILDGSTRKPRHFLPDRSSGVCARPPHTPVDGGDGLDGVLRRPSSSGGRTTWDGLDGLDGQG